MAVLLTQTKPDGRYVASRKTHVAENLYVRHWKIIQLAATGMSDVNIARNLGITNITVQYTLRSPVVQAIVRRMIDDQTADVVDSAKRIKELMPIALQVAEDIMLDQAVSSGVRARTALGIMDRNGFGPVTRSLNTTAVYTADDIVKIRDRARSAGIVVEDVQEAEVMDIEVRSAEPCTNAEGENVTFAHEGAGKSFVSEGTSADSVSRLSSLIEELKQVEA